MNEFAKILPQNTKLYDQTKTLKQQGLTQEDKLSCQCKICKRIFAVKRTNFSHSKIYWAKRNNRPTSEYQYCCIKCHSIGNRNSQWAGGRKKVQGYMFIHKSLVEPEFHYLSKNNYVSEHRYVAAKFLLKKGKKLDGYLHVHHLNGIKDDNHVSNLKIETPSHHCAETHFISYVKDLEKEILKLKNLLRENNLSPVEVEGIEDYKHSENGCD